MSRRRPLGLEELNGRIVPSMTLTFANLNASTVPVNLYMYGNDSTGATRNLSFDTSGNVSLTAFTGTSVPVVPFSAIPLVNNVPTLSLGTQFIDSARIYFAVDGTLNIPVSGTTVTNPSPLISTYNNTAYDWIEFTLDATAAIYINTTQVDAVGLPIQMTINPPDGSGQTKVGLLDARDSIFSSFGTFMQNAPASASAAYGNLVFNDASNDPIRILSPKDAITLNLAAPQLTSYFDSYITTFFDYYDPTSSSYGGSNLILPSVTGVAGTGADGGGVHSLSGNVKTITTSNFLGGSQSYRVLSLTDTTVNGNGTPVSPANGQVYTIFEPFFSSNGASATYTGTPAITAPNATGNPGFNFVTVASTAGITPGMVVAGTGIPLNAIVTGVDASNNVWYTANNNALVSGTVEFFNSIFPAVPALAPVNVAATGAAGSTTLVVADTTGITANGTIYVTGPGIAINNVVTQVDAATNTITLAAPNVAAVNGTVHFAAQSILGNNITLLPSNMVISGSGVFADNTIQYPTNNNQSTLLGAIENMVATSFNRGIATNPVSDWYYNYADEQAGNPNPFYNASNASNPNQTWNYYGQFLHQESISFNGQSYALSFDDQGSFSTTLSESVATNTVVSNITLLPLSTPQTVAVAPDAGGGPHVKLFGPGGVEQFSFLAYDAKFQGGVRVAVGDVNADGVDDIITAPGAGGGPHVKVFNGIDGSLITSMLAYDAAFRGGLYVASGDLDRDGHDDIITAPGAGGGPHVKIFSGRTGALLQNYFAYDSKFHGGVTVAAGDLDGDGHDDVVTGPGPGGGPEIRIFKDLSSVPLISYFAFAATDFGGVFVGTGDLDSDGGTELIVGRGNGSEVRTFKNLSGTPVSDQVIYGAMFKGGVRVGSVVEDDADADLVTAPGPGGGPQVRIGSVSFMAYDPSFHGGVFVAG